MFVLWCCVFSVMCSIYMFSVVKTESKSERIWSSVVSQFFFKYFTKPHLACPVTVAYWLWLLVDNDCFHTMLVFHTTYPSLLG